MPGGEMVGLVGDTAPEFVFRDGARTPPHHVAAYIRRIPDLHTLTYAQALERVNALMLNDHLTVSVKGIVAQHFGVSRG